MRFGSVCSGIEAASVAWHPLGWQAAWFSEIEPFPCAVLAHHYPEVLNHGDMTALPQLIRSGKVEAPDLFCGGTPCQAFSVAGLRRSLDDVRGNLSLTFCEIANAIDSVRARGNADPCIVFWENVPGVLSTKDNAFGCFLAGLAGEDVPLEPAGGKWTDAGVVLGPARAVAWRTLDAQYFGLAQRRRRVFVVASARADFDPAAVLLEWEGVRRDSAPSREAGEGAAPCVTAGAANGGAAHGARSGSAKDNLIVPICPTLRAGGNRTGGDRPPGTDVDTADSLIPVQQPYTVANCLTQRMHKGINTTLDEGQTPVLAHVLRGEGFDASEDGTGRGTPLVPVGVTLHGTDGTQSVASFTDLSSSLRSRIPSGVENSTTTAVLAHAFDARQSNVIQYGDKTGPPDTDGHSVAVAVRTANTSANGHGISAELAHTLDQAQGQAVLAPTLTASNDPSRSPQSSEITAQVAAVVQATAWSIMPQNSGRDYKARQVEVLQPLMAAGPQHGNQGGDLIMQPVTFRDTADCLTSAYGTKWNGNASADNGSLFAAQAVAFDTYNQAVNAHTSQTIKSPQGAVQESVGAVLHAMQVRRLTPTECERLMGFPDSYTAIPWRGKPADQCPDGPRYKALGNSWAVPVVRWIGRRIAERIA